MSKVLPPSYFGMFGKDIRIRQNSVEERLILLETLCILLLFLDCRRDLI